MKMASFLSSLLLCLTVPVTAFAQTPSQHWHSSAVISHEFHKVNPNSAWYGVFIEYQEHLQSADDTIVKASIIRGKLLREVVKEINSSSVSSTTTRIAGNSNVWPVTKYQLTIYFTTRPPRTFVSSGSFTYDESDHVDISPGVNFKALAFQAK